MKGIIQKASLVGCTAVLALAVAGCSSGSETEGQSDAAGAPGQTESAQGSAGQREEAKNEVVVVESGWSVDDQGYVHYGIVLENEGDMAAMFPAVKITGKDADGNVVSSDEQILMGLKPGQRVAWAGQAGTGTAPATVEFGVNVSESSWQKAEAAEDAFEISGTTAQESGFGTVNFVGEITSLLEDEDLGMVAVSVLLRDGSGAIVGGYSGFVNNLAAGSTTSFDVLGYGIPAYETFEVFAQSWT